ncbi:hypothetical protein, partial [Candidatus Venteria ishoeyi]|uniref:hypothetical protein n=1 Tax=Candidatus Venteria ishoeyi TaxID=1899563 RepID=UPI0015AD20BB
MHLKKMYLNLFFKYWCFLPVIVIVFYFAFLVYPGGWSPDTYSMWTQAMGYSPETTTKPMLFKIVWKYLSFLPGEGGMLILHIIVYLLSIIMLVSVLFKNFFIRLIISIFIALFPPLLTMNLTVWIGTSSLDALMLATALIVIYFYHSKKVSLLWLALLVMLYGSLTRYNTISMFMFIVLFVSILISKHYDFKNYYRLSIFSLVFMFFVVWVGSMHYLNGDARKINILKYSYIWQLIGISLIQEKNYVPKPLLHENIRDLPEKKILKIFRQNYKTINNYNLWKPNFILIGREENKRYMGYAYQVFGDNLGSYLFN